MGEIMMFLWLLMVVTFGGGCQGRQVYRVGGSSGWTNINIATSHYRYWSASKIFHVGDILWFEYNKQFHNVVRVRHEDFNSCNSTAPYSTWATGNDFFTITMPGHFYFICGLPGHCQAGQKVDIRVLGHHKTEHGPSPSPSGLRSPGPSPQAPCWHCPLGPSAVPLPLAHSRKSGSYSLSSSWKLWLLVTAIALVIYYDFLFLFV